MRGTVDDKVLVPLAGQPILCHSIDAFRESDAVSQIVIVYRDDEQKSAIQKAIETAHTNGLEFLWATGGKERQDSVFNGLSELSLLVDHVFIHDCARPMVRTESIRKLCTAVTQDKAAVLAHRVADTNKKVRAT